jgi:hypothetical protein
MVWALEESSSGSIEADAMDFAAALRPRDQRVSRPRVGRYTDRDLSKDAPAVPEDIDAGRAVAFGTPSSRDGGDSGARGSAGGTPLRAARRKRRRMNVAEFVEMIRPSPDEERWELLDASPCRWRRKPSRHSRS